MMETTIFIHPCVTGMKNASMALRHRDVGRPEVQRANETGTWSDPRALEYGDLIR